CGSEARTGEARGSEARAGNARGSEARAGNALGSEARAGNALGSEAGAGDARTDSEHSAGEARADAKAQRGEAWLVGAAPGSRELIPVRGRQLLAGADAVLDDRLGAPELLRFARRDAELIGVGKTPHRPS